MNWDDIKIFLVVQEEGAVSKAATKLGMNATTIMRRIQRLERHFGGMLFLDRRGHKVLSPLGDDVLERARALQANAHAIDMLAADQSETPSGNVRISSTYPVARHLISPAIKSFHHSYPDIYLDLITDNGIADLANMEAEIALRMYRPKQGPYVARKIGALHHSLYRSVAYKGVTKWIGFSSVLSGSIEVKKFEATLAPKAIRMRSNDPLIMADMAAEGLGLVILPSCQGDKDARLRRVKKLPEPLPIWLVMKQDVARLPAVRATANWLGKTMMHK